MDNVINWIPQWDSWPALLLYWVPMALCAYEYAVMAGQGYRADLQQRAREDVSAAAGRMTPYSPALTVGTLVGYLLATTVPAVNLIAAVLHVAPRVFGDLFPWLGKALDIPLVPKREGWK